ncbi:hypothetical protein [Ulvibacterium sp.]|uniref:hypothetical protein n=1 Tax=Ulvibacterium sp. TaxID=2665914 RepID=UPI002612124C|nr:hypothetical protein [Ulvibacterium sp.]
MRNVIIVSGLLFCMYLFPQQGASKNDIIFTTNGQLLQVKVTKVTDGAISFVYPGETIVNEINPTKLEKIVFASGRTQDFGGVGGEVIVAKESPANASTFMEEAPMVPSYEENIMSVVPLDFKRNGKYDKTLANKATEYVIGLMSGKSNTQGVQVLDMGKAIERLVDSGFSYGKLRQSSPEQLRDALETEYILFVSIKENEKNGNPESDLMAQEVSSKNTQLERIINIRLYGADSEVESFEMDFSENVFLNKSTNGPNLLAGGKWKSSLRYLAEQLFASNVFTD